MRKLLRSMARAAMVAAGMERINRGSRFSQNWRNAYKHQIKTMSAKITEKPKISKTGRKFNMFKRYESLKADMKIRKIMAEVAR